MIHQDSGVTVQQRKKQCKKMINGTSTFDRVLTVTDFVDVKALLYLILIYDIQICTLQQKNGKFHNYQT